MVHSDHELVVTVRLTACTAESTIAIKNVISPDQYFSSLVLKKQRERLLQCNALQVFKLAIMLARTSMFIFKGVRF